MAQISIVKYSDVIKAQRFDAEYFKLEYLEIEKKLLALNSVYFKDYLIEITGGATPLGANYQKQGVPFLRVQNIMQNYINDNDLVFLSKRQDEEIKRSRLKTGDVLLTITGAYGKSAPVTERFNNANINQHSVRMRFKSILNPYYVSTFLNSKYGKKQSDKKIVGISRPALDYQTIKTFLIPLLPQSVQLKIEQIVKEAYKKQDKAKQLYKEAEELLLKELDLIDYKPKHRLTFEATKSKVDKVKRFDAEYFQPKYDEVCKRVYKKGIVLLKDIAKLINYGTVPTSPYVEKENGIPYIKGLNLKNTEIITDKLDYINNVSNLPSKFYTEKGDIIISQMGTVGDTGVVTKDNEGWIFASFTIRVRLKNEKMFNPYFVALYIQDIAKKYYLLRNIAQSSVRQNTDLPTIKNMPIPLIDKSIQSQIAEKIKESHKLRKKSKELLEKAKRMVEEEIEKRASID